MPYRREPWFARRDAAYGVVLDAHGKIAWGRSNIGGDLIVAVLTEQVSDARLAGLPSRLPKGGNPPVCDSPPTSAERLSRPIADIPFRGVRPLMPGRDSAMPLPIGQKPACAGDDSGSTGESPYTGY